MSTGKQKAVEAIRQDLLQSSASLLAGNEADALGGALRRFFPKLSHAFVVHWIPEQAEDIYWVLVSRTDIAEIEIPRSNYAEANPPLLKILDVGAYREKRHSRDVRQKLEIGLELIKSS
ncbi:hypothetical protein BWP39_05460 [Paraburkholderia acidicola]|uniref:Uncharacterized protein n=1 Tax=Paraburkholderia acidicola TaxID=1912599 RepID=A0A2A4F5U1_9BURK|nr:hypothetical protein [Paraburkholderia acidicola]PCE27954.1 hypothetical protein BWP39_05460 [Paraburkholderia acidicola]